MKKQNDDLAVRLAERIREEGGRVYYVGGCVRDRIMCIESKDTDVEVYGITPARLKEICADFGVVDEVGASFGILKIHGYDIDIAMPRKERAVGEGHRAFEVSVDPFLSTEGAASRRDFTMNALMQGVLTGEVIDHFGGKSDIENGVIRHIDGRAFAEDPLRVFRAAGFAARFGFRIADETVRLCSGMDVRSLPRERVYEETNKALLKAERPSVYFTELDRMGKLADFFPELERLHGVPQNPFYHPEGDVWAHTMIVIDNAAKCRAEVSDPLGFMYAAAFHDLGKITATVYDGKKGKYTSIGHEKEGMPMVRSAVRRLTDDKRLTGYIETVVLNHMRPHQMTEQTSVHSTNRLFDRFQAPRDIVLFACCDAMREDASDLRLLRSGWWDERIKQYEEIRKLPEVTGKDLIEMGYKPGPLFKRLLEKCHDAHLAGTDFDTVLERIPNYVRGIKKSEKSRKAKEEASPKHPGQREITVSELDPDGRIPSFPSTPDTRPFAEEKEPEEREER